MKTTNAIGLIAAVCATVAAMGCGGVPTSEDVGTTQQAFNNYVSISPPFTNAVIPFDTSTTRLFQNGDWDNDNTIPHAQRYTYTLNDGFFFGAECALITSFHDYVIGISSRTYIGRAHSVKCNNNDSHHVTGAPASYHYLSREDSSGNPRDDRVGSDVGWDWDPGAIKADCGFHQAVTGVAQLESNEIDGIACTSASVNSGPSTSTCNKLVFDGNNHCPVGGCGSPDWAPGYAKNLCRSDQYIKAISKNKTRLNGEISAILCCNWG